MLFSFKLTQISPRIPTHTHSVATHWIPMLPRDVQTCQTATSVQRGVRGHNWPFLGSRPKRAKPAGAESAEFFIVAWSMVQRLVIGFLRVPGCPRGGGVPGEP